MILLTGASGKTGKAILSALHKRNAEVRVLVRTAEQAALLTTLGASDAVIGDLRDNNSLQLAAAYCESIYFICPNVTPDEVEIGKNLLSAAKSNRVKRFVYHSVLHPQIEAMPHHWQKMRMEECLFESGFDFTILQPCAYMQNILANWKSISDTGIYATPYSTSARLSIVDLEDIAEAAATVLTENEHVNAIYELAGPEPLSQVEVAAVLSKCLKRNVSAKVIDRNEWALNAKTSITSEYQIKTLLCMFEYYEKYGLVGNSNALSHLIKRKANDFEFFVNRQITR